MRISYVLPIKWEGDNGLDELTTYLASIAAQVDLIIVDGSSAQYFNHHKALWSAYGRHLAPDASLNFINGKVNGVLTGLQLADFNQVVIADDDVRYELDQLVFLESQLEEVQLVVPQNYFSPNPWHGQWDTSRTLLNRAFHHDYPGTLAIQRDFINHFGGYDGDVMFENLELIRTVQAAGGKIKYCDNLYVKRLPPTDQHFLSQRVRQAFDDNAQPLRLTFFFLLLPGLIASAFISPVLPLALLASSVLFAEIGRRRQHGEQVFAVACALYAPCWLLERGICTWLALFQRLAHGGVKYNGRIIKIAANPVWKLRSKFNARLFAKVVNV
jgi:hypothetical protein